MNGSMNTRAARRTAAPPRTIESGIDATPDPLIMLGDLLARSIGQLQAAERNLAANAGLPSYRRSETVYNVASERLDALEMCVAHLPALGLEGALVQLRVLSSLVQRDAGDRDWGTLSWHLVHSITAVVERVAGIDRTRFAGLYYQDPRFNPFANLDGGAP